MRRVFFLISGFLIFSLLTGCQQQKIEQKTQEAIPVKALPVARRDIAKALEYVGNIKARDEAVVYPKVSGKIIEKVKGEGEKVAKNEVIAYIDRDEVGLKFNKAPVESPLAGVVGRVYVDLGANVSAATPVALIVDMDKVKINLDIPEIYLPKIYPGQEVRVKADAYPDKEFNGIVTQVSPVVNLENRASPVEITIDNPRHDLKSGMFAKAALILEARKDARVIIKEAVLGRPPDNYVYVVENNKAFSRKIVLGIHYGSDYEVLEGLKEGDLVVIIGQQKLYDGALVIVEENNG